MGLNETPSAERVHIGFFGKRNAGKSSVVNAVTGQELAVVSDIKGTTTDPVYKAMELLPLGPVMIIDTPGIDDEGTLGKMRVKKSRQIINKTDIAVLIIDSEIGKTKEDQELIEIFGEKQINYIVAYNKAEQIKELKTAEKDNEIYISAKTGHNIQELKEKIAKLSFREESGARIVGDLIKPSDFVVLVTPIDKAAPKGRLILPQQQTIRDILDSGAISIVTLESELKNTLKTLGKKPSLVITDSQVFAKASEDTPSDIFLTSFSILFARYKGTLKTAVNGAKALNSLKDFDKVLISEGCTHHRQCEDIGTVKLPKWIKEYTNKKVEFDFTSGREFPEDLSKYKMIVHCGGCMLNEREMKYRQRCAEEQEIPFTNYGILIAYMQGILERSIQMFPDINE